MYLIFEQMRGIIGDAHLSIFIALVRPVNFVYLINDQCGIARQILARSFPAIASFPISYKKNTAD
jgi:hypothetical protein